MDQLRLLQFQASAFQDLASPLLQPLLPAAEELADELASLAKWGQAGPEGSGAHVALAHAVGLLSSLLLAHGDLAGAAAVFTSRLAQQQLAHAKATLREVGSVSVRLRVSRCAQQARGDGRRSPEGMLSSSLLPAPGARRPWRSSWRTARPGPRPACGCSSALLWPLRSPLATPAQQRSWQPRWSAAWWR